MHQTKMKDVQMFEGRVLYQFGTIEIDTLNFSLTDNGQARSVEPQVFDLIVYLIKHRDRVLTRDEIFDDVWEGRHVSDTSLSNHIKTARRVLGDTAQEQNIIKTMRGRGYQFVANVNERPTRSRLILKAKRMNAVFFAVTIVLLLAIIAFLVLSPRQISTKIPQVSAQDETVLSLETLAVLPLVNTSADTQIEFLGLALTDQIIGRLAYIENIAVRPAALTRQFQHTQKNPIDIGRGLAVDYIMSGTYLKHEDRFRLHLELINVRTEELIWREDFELDYENVFQLQDTVALRIFNKFYLSGNEKHMASKRASGLVRVAAPQHPAAYEFYLRSIASPMTEGGNNLAVSMLKQSIALDHNYAPAHAELGRRLHQLSAQGLQGTHATNDAETHLRQALTLDPKSLSALANLTVLYTDNGDLLNALEVAREMLKINPNTADAYFSLGYVYRYAGLLEASIEMMEKALLIDPTNKKFRSAGVSYYSVGRYEDAHRVFDLDEGTAFTLSWHAILCHREGQLEKAAAYFDQAIAVAPNGYFALDSKAYKAAMFGDRATGLKMVKRLETTQITDIEVRYFWALYYAALGERESALRILREVVNAGYYNLPAFNTDPFLDPIRNDPEFIKILALAQKGRQDFKTASEKF